MWLHPIEARSHFEIVDPGVWRVVRVGEGTQFFAKYWTGPFPFAIDGVQYEAFAERDACAASQETFLKDLGVESSGESTAEDVQFYPAGDYIRIRRSKSDLCILRS